MNSKDNKKPTLFISYCWSDGNNYADELETQLTDVFEVKRDKSQLIVNDNLYDFMAEIANCNYVIIVLTSAYVNSLNCMLEMSYILEQPDWENKLMVLVINEDLYKTEKKLEILNFWNSRRKKLIEMSDSEKVGLEIIEEEKKYVESISKCSEVFLYGLSRRKNPTQIAVVNEMIKKAKNSSKTQSTIVTEREQLLLDFIKNNNGLSVREIAEKMCYSHAFTTRLLRGLLDKDVIEVTGSVKERRYYYKQ